MNHIIYCYDACMLSIWAMPAPATMKLRGDVSGPYMAARATCSTMHALACDHRHYCWRMSHHHLASSRQIAHPKPPGLQFRWTAFGSHATVSAQSLKGQLLGKDQYATATASVLATQVREVLDPRARLSAMQYGLQTDRIPDKSRHSIQFGCNHKPGTDAETAGASRSASKQCPAATTNSG